MLETLEHVTRPDPTWSVVWLHGLGADGHDFAPIVPELVRPEWPGIRFVFPHAPVRPVTVNNGTPMRAWYDLLGFDIASRQDAPGIRASIAEVERLIAREGERGIDPGRILLAGFSQGGAVALATGLRRQRALAGVVALSTYLPLADSAATEATAAGRGTPVFMAHGSQDPVVGERLGLLSRDALRDLGVDVAWHSYPMAHQVCMEEIQALGDWMQVRFAG
ncbi:alpha/beta hydrolase [Coralloluteibacterium stylophorae]|uniref:Alpha/beta fold hydrolase n=1 Tax=Coralloluteibacterium stylophorae TaxID=1776034 RepID=A0A8J7VSN1_9GAMM|nr:alpha/beta fold hydrolase [Coralloluteibacterium stylophorae]MBS7458830.1 alpha/beta fold hydrolase [Coralloluteibacterium stylophorae]